MSVDPKALRNSSDHADEHLKNADAEDPAPTRRPGP
jgi:hypothetical protein